MAKDPKTGKKPATKPAKVAGVHKVPNYAKGDQTGVPSPLTRPAKGTK